MQSFFSGQMADGDSAVHTGQGGLRTVVAWGTFGGGTLTLQMSPDGGTTWLSLGADVEFTADGVANVQLGAGIPLRANLAGSTGANVRCKAF